MFKWVSIFLLKADLVLLQRWVFLLHYSQEEFWFQPLWIVWLFHVQKAEFDKEIEFGGIGCQIGFKPLLQIISVKIISTLGFENTYFETNQLWILIIKQTNQMYIFHSASVFSIQVTEGLKAKFFWRYSSIVDLLWALNNDICDISNSIWV